MKIVCAWCDKDMGGKPPYEDGGTSHTICEDCLKKYFGKEVKIGKDKMSLLWDRV